MHHVTQTCSPCNQSTAEVTSLTSTSPKRSTPFTTSVLHSFKATLSDNFPNETLHVLGGALGMSHTEIILLMSVFDAMSKISYPENVNNKNLTIDDCLSPVSCARKAFLRILTRFHTTAISDIDKEYTPVLHPRKGTLEGTPSSILQANFIWHKGVFERKFWLNDFLLQVVAPMIPKSSICLEWGTEFMNTLLPNCRQEIFEYADPPLPKWYNKQLDATVYYDDIHDASTVPDNHFDFIIATQVHEHLHNPFLATANMAKKLKPGGYLVATGPHVSPYHGVPDDFYRYTHHGIAHIFKTSGLVPIYQQVHGGIMMAVSILEGYDLEDMPKEFVNRMDLDPENPFPTYTHWSIIGQKPKGVGKERENSTPLLFCGIDGQDHNNDLCAEDRKERAWQKRRKARALKKGAANH